MIENSKMLLEALNHLVKFHANFKAIKSVVKRFSKATSIYSKSIKSIVKSKRTDNELLLTSPYILQLEFIISSFSSNLELITNSLTEEHKFLKAEGQKIYKIRKQFIQTGGAISKFKQNTNKLYFNSQRSLEEVQEKVLKIDQEIAQVNGMNLEFNKLYEMKSRYQTAKKELETWENLHKVNKQNYEKDEEYFEISLNQLFDDIENKSLTICTTAKNSIISFKKALEKAFLNTVNSFNVCNVNKDDPKNLASFDPNIQLFKKVNPYSEAVFIEDGSKQGNNFLKKNTVCTHQQQEAGEEEEKVNVLNNSRDYNLKTTISTLFKTPIRATNILDNFKENHSNNKRLSSSRVRINTKDDLVFTGLLKVNETQLSKRNKTKMDDVSLEEKLDYSDILMSSRKNENKSKESLIRMINSRRFSNQQANDKKPIDDVIPLFRPFDIDSCSKNPRYHHKHNKNNQVISIKKPNPQSPRNEDKVGINETELNTINLSNMSYLNEFNNISQTKYLTSRRNYIRDFELKDKIDHGHDEIDYIGVISRSNSQQKQKASIITPSKHLEF